MQVITDDAYSSRTDSLSGDISHLVQCMVRTSSALLHVVPNLRDVNYAAQPSAHTTAFAGQSIFRREANVRMPLNC